MGFNLTEYTLNTLIDMLNNMRTVVKVGSTFHSQMKQINALFRNDKTALIMPILNFMIKTANVPITFDANKTGLQKVFNDWQKNVNKNLNIDIPKGLYWVGEQNYRERYKSSLIAIRLKWDNVNGWILPTRIWVMDGSSLYIKNDSGSLNTNEYYLGNPRKDSSKRLINTNNETVLIRKPFAQGYEQYPVPYLVQRGALEYALSKAIIVEKQQEMISSAFPYYLALKLGSDEAMRRSQMPTPADLEKMADDFKEKRNEYDNQSYAKGLIGGHPHDFNIDEFIPDFAKVMDEKILKPVDKNLLYALGLIELKGFSSTREEAILNPKVLVEEVENAVLDYVKVLEEIVQLIQEKNSDKYTANDTVSVQPGIIKAFLTDEMKTLIRSWYDRGLIGYKSALEATTALKFETQIKERKREIQEKINQICYPRIIQNLEKDPADLTPQDDDVPDDKKKNTPESKNYKNASNWITCSECGEIFDYTSYIETGTEYVSCPSCNIKIDFDGNSSKEKGEYIEAPYTKKNYPSQIKNLPSGARTIWIETFNRVLKETNDEDQARKAAWRNVKLEYFKDKDGKWKKRKSK